MMPMVLSLHAPSRRELLLASGVLFAWAHLPKIARAEGRDPRFLTIVLRGALDGLATVAPVGDPAWIKLRGDKALTREGAASALELDGFFGLYPAMPNVHRLYRAGLSVFVHATATSFRERSRRRHGQRRRWEAECARRRRRRAGAGVLRGIRRRSREVSGAARRTADWRARV